MVEIYHDGDADLEVLGGRLIGIIGYGNQGRAQALNLRDSGLDVIVGCPPDEYRRRAREDGFDTCSVREAAERAQVLAMLIPDEVQPEVFEQHVRPGLREGDALDFASGYNIYYELVQPPDFVDVIMVAPRMIGAAVRSLFEQGSGYPCLVAVDQDATGTAMQTALAFTLAIGGTKGGAFASSFKEETLMDLLAEQFLWAGIVKLCTVYYETLVEAGCTPETVATEMYLSGEMVEVAQAMVEEGFFKQLDLHSHTSQYGQLSRGDLVLGEGIRERARRILEGIRNGDFAREWTREQQQGMPRLKELKAEALSHPLNEVERRLKP